MRALLSAVGTRGDVQPLVALASSVRELGHEARLCVPPNFVDWVRELGFEAIPVGVEMRLPASRAGAAPLTAEQLQRLRESMPDLISDQFSVLERAAQGCDVILGANAHQYAARSIAELRAVPHVSALYAPVAIPSSDHAPPPAPGEAWAQADAAHHLQRWTEQRRAWNERALERVNHNRTKRGLSAIDSVLDHNITVHPWLATDPALAPLPATPGLTVLATGAWILPDSTALPRELLDFLDQGEPPIYLGFGSMPAREDVGRTLLAATRAVGRRAIVARGWAQLSVGEPASDCLVIDDVNHQRLFPRLAAVVHHGGAGTTATAARAGVPQLVAPMFSDQFYWASRVAALGIGASLVGPSAEQSLSAALEQVLNASVFARARSLAPQLDAHGAQVAARRLMALA